MKQFCLFLFLGLQAATVFAQETKNCEAELKQFCSATVPGPETVKCLLEHEKESSEPCKQEIQRMAQASRAAHRGGLGNFSAVMGGMSLGASPIPMLVYGGSTTLARHGTPAIDQHRLNFSMPVYKDGDDFYSASLTAAQTRFAEPLILPDTGRKMPTEFNKVEFGGQFSRQLPDDHSVGIRASFGSASDQIFMGEKDLTYSASGSYSFPGRNKDHVVLTIFVSNNNPLLNYIPIPGFIYFTRTATFTGMFGFPFASMQWTPIEHWAYSLSFFGPSMNAEAIYGDRDQLQFFTGYNWSIQSYMRHDREIDEDRTYLTEQRVVAGVRSPLTSKISAELQGGYAFHRSIYEGSRFDKRLGGSLDLEDSWMIGWNLKASFF